MNERRSYRKLLGGGVGKPDAGERADAGDVARDRGTDVANLGSGGAGSAGGIVATGGAPGSGGVVATGGAPGIGGAADAGAAPDARDASDAGNSSRPDGAANSGADSGTVAATCAARASCRYE